MIAARIALVAWLATGCVTQPEPRTCPDGFDCAFVCEQEDCGEVVCGRSECAVTCDVDAVCPSVDCTDALCDVTCAGASACDDIDCTGAAGCHVVCSGGSTCHVDCTGARVCTDVSCTQDSGCVLQCADANNCAFASCDGGSGIEACPGDVLVCNRPCPTCGDGTCDASLESASACPEDCGAV